MQRVVAVGAIVLTALIVIQFVALRRMRGELAQLRVRAAAMDVEARRDEIDRAGAWLHAWLQSPDGGSQAAGLCPAGAPSMDVIRARIFGTYLSSRASGATEAQAREAVIGAIRTGQ